MPGLIRPKALWLAVEPVDMRRGVEGLSLHVQQMLGADPCDGSAYLFRNKRGTRIKLLVWDGNGVWLCQRRLHRGSSPGPSLATACSLTFTVAVAGRRSGLAALCGPATGRREALKRLGEND